MSRVIFIINTQDDSRFSWNVSHKQEMFRLVGCQLRLLGYNIVIIDEERLAKNTQIQEQGKQPREKLKGQVCRVYCVKIYISHLNEAQKITSTHELEYLDSQMKQSVIQQGIQDKGG